MKMQTKVERLAMNDAYDIKALQLLIPDVQWKVERISGYLEAFNKAGDKLDMKQEAKILEDARKRLVKKGFTGEKVSNKARNVKIVLVIAGTVYVLHEMGYLERAKQAYRRGKLYVNALQDPESQEYKDFVDNIANKVQTVVDGEPHYKTRNTVKGETVADTPEQEENLRQHVQDVAAGIDETGENPWDVSDSGTPKDSPSQES